MSEIQQWAWGMSGMLQARANSRADFVTYQDYLSALEAKDEEHTQAVGEVQAYWLGKFSTLQEKHAAEIAALRGTTELALFHYRSGRLLGEPCMIHRSFASSMDRLCMIALDCDVQLYITHSIRRLDQVLQDTVVEQALRSNHHAGSAVDFNPVYEGVWYTSDKMKDWVSLPTPVKQFLTNVMDDDTLRWGGGFSTPDPVHFDDNLVRRDPEEWQRRVAELRGTTP